MNFEFDRRNNLRILDLERLHHLQSIFCGVVDISIETRKDMRITAVSFCGYTEEFESKSKLHIHKLSWDKDNTEEIEKIKQEIEKLCKKY